MCRVVHLLPAVWLYTQPLERKKVTGVYRCDFREGRKLNRMLRLCLFVFFYILRAPHNTPNALQKATRIFANQNAKSSPGGEESCPSRSPFPGVMVPMGRFLWTLPADRFIILLASLYARDGLALNMPKPRRLMIPICARNEME